jgi:hypothetical protein
LLDALDKLDISMVPHRLPTVPAGKIGTEKIGIIGPGMNESNGNLTKQNLGGINIGFISLCMQGHPNFIWKQCI